jgi:hypothetical protein
VLGKCHRLGDPRRAQSFSSNRGQRDGRLGRQAFGAICRDDNISDLLVQRTRWYGSFDAWVEKEILPNLESGTLDHDFIIVVAALRRWDEDGTLDRANAS